MIRFSAALVAVAIGVLIGGIATSKLLLVYVAIVVSAVALVALAIGVVLKREELFGEERGLVPANAGASPVLQAAIVDDRGGDGQEQARQGVREARPAAPFPEPVAGRLRAARARQADARPTRHHRGKPSPRRTRGHASSLSRPRQAGRPPTGTTVSRGRPPRRTLADPQPRVRLRPGRHPPSAVAGTPPRPTMPPARVKPRDGTPRALLRERIPRRERIPVPERASGAGTRSGAGTYPAELVRPAAGTAERRRFFPSREGGIGIGIVRRWLVLVEQGFRRPPHGLRVRQDLRRARRRADPRPARARRDPRRARA